MKLITKLTSILALIIITAPKLLFAQTTADIFDKNKPVTWLGLDCSQMVYIGVAPGNDPQPGKKIEVDNDQFRNMYTRQWNELIIDEPKKYDIAKAVGRPTVKYAIDVTLQANKKLTDKNFFDPNPSNFKKLDETKIAGLVKNYDFQNNEGIGLLFFIEGISKGQESEGLWITFVDMKSKTVLLTRYTTGKPGGFGFRNYWAKPIYTTIKDMESNFSQWSKQVKK